MLRGHEISSSRINLNFSVPAIMMDNIVLSNTSRSEKSHTRDRILNDYVTTYWDLAGFVSV